MTDVVVTGLSDLQKLLDSLPAKIEANVMRGALRAGIKPILEKAKSNAPVLSGELRDGLKIRTNSRRGVVTASIRATGKHAFLAPFIEYGTAEHAISGGNGGFLVFGGNVYRQVMHPGLKPKPFLRPALDSGAQIALVEAGNYIKKRLATKHGIDTADIQIGDE